MADPPRAAQLVSEDAYSSRGIGYNELPAAAEERLLFDAERASTDVEGERATPYWAKGKGRSEDGEEDDMAWEPPPTAEQAHRRRMSGEAQYQPPTQQRQHGSASSNRRGSEGGAGGGGSAMTSLEKRRIRLLWWKAAGVNVLFICAWYTFSTCISVYSEFV